jgi:hypothetical protein
VDGIGAEIDPDAECVFHQPEVFIASPEQGLKVGRDLQSDLQRNRQPPMRWVGVDVERLRPEKAAAGADVRVIAAGFEEIPKARGEPERKLWAF